MVCGSQKTFIRAILAKAAAAVVVVAAAVVVAMTPTPPQVVAQLLRMVEDAVAVVVVDAATALEAVEPGAAVAAVLGAAAAATHPLRRENHSTRTCSTSMLLSQDLGPSLQRLQVAITRETQRLQLVLRALERYQR